MAKSSRRVRPIVVATFALLCLTIILPLSGQNEQKATDENAQEWLQPHSKERKFTAADLLKAFEAPEESAYQLGGGDEIAIEIWGRPELSGKQQVGPDGRITLPVIGSIHVSGLTRELAATAVTQALARIYTNIAVTVQVERYLSNRIFILGRVANPGALLFDRTPTLLEAIARAGSLPVGGLGAEKAALTRCAIFRGRDEIAWIDLKALLTNADLTLNIRLRRDDIVYLPDADEQLVYVMGEVHTPGALHLTPDMSFLDALQRSGGTTEDAATTKIQLIRASHDVRRGVSLSELLRPNANQNFALEEGDIIYVPKRNLAKMGYVLQKLGPVGGLVVVGTAVGK